MDRVLQRRDTTANWSSTNPILAEGELGIITDGAKGYKIGDGLTRWNALEFPANPTNVVGELGDSEVAAVSQKLVTDLNTNNTQLIKDSFWSNYFTGDLTVNSTTKTISITAGYVVCGRSFKRIEAAAQSISFVTSDYTQIAIYLTEDGTLHYDTLGLSGSYNDVSTTTDMFLAIIIFDSSLQVLYQNNICKNFSIDGIDYASSSYAKTIARSYNSILSQKITNYYNGTISYTHSTKTFTFSGGYYVSMGQAVIQINDPFDATTVIGDRTDFTLGLYIDSNNTVNAMIISGSTAFNSDNRFLCIFMYSKNQFHRVVFNVAVTLNIDSNRYDISYLSTISDLTKTNDSKLKDITITEIPFSNWAAEGFYLFQNLSIGDDAPTNPTTAASTSWHNIKTAISAGDIIIVTDKGSDNAPHYVLTGKGGVIMQMSPKYGEQIIKTHVVAADQDGYLFANHNGSSGASIIIYSRGLGSLTYQNIFNGFKAVAFGGSNTTEIQGTWFPDLCSYYNMIPSFNGCGGATFAKLNVTNNITDDKGGIANDPVNIGKPNNSITQLEYYLDTYTDTPDIIMICFGVNDAFWIRQNNAYTIGNLDTVMSKTLPEIYNGSFNDDFSIYTLLGSMRYVLETLKTTHPNTPIIGVLPWQCYAETTVGSNTYDRNLDYYNIIKGPMTQMYQMYSCPVIDAWSEGGFVSAFEVPSVRRYTIDGLHVRTANTIKESGRKVQAYFIRNQFKQKYTKL